ncbi:MAG: NUDIX hydrolase [Ornithinimicrobium sp.]|uniref:NUDIX hydrolase n=1 Tax=Ornithinimicrobium sp. TaxID=1977084 RepID=UPI003D9BB202
MSAETVQLQEDLEPREAVHGEDVVGPSAPTDALATGETSAAVVRAAGVLPWRRKKKKLQVLLVHRPRYDDWAWAKGKLERGEDVAACAGREALEETGLKVRLGVPLPGSVYALPKVGDRTVIKRVDYWAAEPIGGSGRLEEEIDEVAWLKPAKARKRLSYVRDREQLDTLVEYERDGRLDTWTLLVVRHAKAMARKEWAEADPLRPLTVVGRRRSDKLVDILTAYAPEQVLSSTSTRCHDTVAPFTQTAVVPLRTKRGLSEEGYDVAPDKVHKHLRRMFERGRTIAVCTHGPVLEAVLADLAGRADTPAIARAVRRVTATSMDKGEVLACTVQGRGPTARIVATRRHRIPR